MTDYRIVCVITQGEQQLRTQLEKDLAETQRRLDAAEKARDAAIKSREQAAVRGASTGRRTHS